MTLIYLLILFGYIFTLGYFSTFAIIVLFISYLLFFISTSRPIFTQKIYQFKPSSLLLISAILSTLMYARFYQNISSLNLLGFVLSIISIILLILMIKTENNLIIKRIFIGMLIVAVVTRILGILVTPSPYIDVYVFLKSGVLKFVSGINPYTLSFPEMYKGVAFNYYAYPPGMLFLTLPLTWFTKDPRITIMAVEILSALLIFKNSPGGKNKYLYPLIFLFNPVGLYITVESYTEPLIVFLILFCMILVQKKRFILSALVFGITLASKQYLFLLIPLYYKLLKLSKQRTKSMIVAFGISAGIVIPFIIWDSQEFIHDVITLQFSYPPRYEGLGIFSLLYRLGINYNALVSLFIILVSFVIIYLRKNITVPKFFYLSSLLFFSFFIFNKWAFVNYYYLISQLFLLGIIFSQDSAKGTFIKKGLNIAGGNLKK